MKFDLKQTQFKLDRRQFLGGAAMLGIMAMTGCSNSDNAVQEAATLSTLEPDGDLNLFTYADYIAPEVLTGFEEEYGVKINMTYYSTGDEMIAKLGSGQPFDVTTAPSERIMRMAEGGLLNKVDHDALTNYSHVIPAFQLPPYNGNDEAANKETVPFVAAPYAVAGVGLAWQKDQVSGLTESFSDLWNSTDAKGRVYLWDDMQVTLSMALLHLGISPQGVNKEGLDQAVEALQEIKPILGGFAGMDTQMMENNQAWITPVYAGDLFNALESLPDPDNWGFQTCKESALFNADNLVIPATSKHTGTALLFIDWMLAPENVEKNVEFTGYAIPTETGMETFRGLTEDYPYIQTDEALFSDVSQWLTPIPADDQRMWQQAWNSVKA